MTLVGSVSLSLHLSTPLTTTTTSVYRCSATQTVRLHAYSIVVSGHHAVSPVIGLLANSHLLTIARFVVMPVDTSAGRRGQRKAGVQIRGCSRGEMNKVRRMQLCLCLRVTDSYPVLCFLQQERYIIFRREKDDKESKLND